ncbi:hypothetical protein GCM10009554_00240 [Kribbella koreensis]|uniref:Peptidase C14 caspase domain-containing protein n=1 Tax=Kribbella koreensis TaxID=57909 RepID=A0ABP3ZI93_9ACTN
MAGSREALVIANADYANPGLSRLMAPARDAAALAGVLGDPEVGGFDVTVLENESAQTIRFAVEDFFSDRSPEDLLLLHFSCHGLKNAAGELFLAVADTQPTRLASTAVPADFVNRQMADSRAQRIALFLDCCYGGAFPRGLVVRAAGEAQVRDAFAGQDGVGGGRGRVVVTASSAMEYAFEDGRLASGTPKPSVFTSAVVDGLKSGDADKDGDGWVGLTELVGYVTDQVHRKTPNQNPQMWTFGSQGELLIARSHRLTPTTLAPELLEAMTSPLSAARFGVVDYLRDCLTGHDQRIALAAHAALTQMTTDDSRKVSEAAQQALTQTPPTLLPLIQRPPATTSAPPEPKEHAPEPASGQVAPPPTTPAVQAPTAAPTSTSVPWWVVGVLVVGGLLLVVVNWPGVAESRRVWSDDSNTGWRTFRSWSDPEMVASVVVLGAALFVRWAGRWSLVLLGIALGCTGSIGEDGVLILAGGLADEETAEWLVAGLIVFVMTVVLLVVLKPPRPALRPVHPQSMAMIVAGGIVLVISATIKHSDGINFVTVTKLALLEPVVTVALGWLAIAATDLRTRVWLTATTITYAVVSMVAVVPALTEGDSVSVLLTGLLGNLLVIAGVANRRPDSLPT